MNSQLVLVSDAVIDYAYCPMRYAFIWHYGVDVKNKLHQILYVRVAAVHEVFKSLHFGLSKNLPIAINKITTDLDDIHKASIYGASIKLAASLPKVLAFDLPLLHKIGPAMFSTSVAIAGDMCINYSWPVPSITRWAVESIVSISRMSLKSSGLSLKQGVIKINGPSFVVQPICPDIKKAYIFLTNVAVGIRNRVFYPRRDGLSCHSCGFGSICSPAWGTRLKLKTPEKTRTEIERRLERNARTFSN